MDEIFCNNLIDVIENYNKDLMIILDDVYGIFVEDFLFLMLKLFYNIVGVYFYLKYFGVIGWRFGIFVFYKKNVFDKKINDLIGELKKLVDKCYSDMSFNFFSFLFMERVVVDSRFVVFNYIVGFFIL